MIALSFRLIARRSRIYAIAIAVTIVAQAAIAFLLHVPHALLYSNFVVPPILTTLTYAFVWADVQAEAPTAAAIWERILERSWAVIVIDLIVSVVLIVAQNSAAAGMAAGDFFDAIGGFAMLFIGTTLVFADASATLDEMPAWMLVFGGFWRSISVSMRGRAFVRAVAIVAISLVAGYVADELGELLLKAHLANADFWSQVPLGALTDVPIAVLTAVVYLDARAQTDESGTAAP